MQLQPLHTHNLDIVKSFSGELHKENRNREKRKNYRRIGKDIKYFTGGGLISLQGNSDPQPFIAQFGALVSVNQCWFWDDKVEAAAVCGGGDAEGRGRCDKGEDKK